MLILHSVKNYFTQSRKENPRKVAKKSSATLPGFCVKWSSPSIKIIMPVFYIELAAQVPSLIQPLVLVTISLLPVQLFRVEGLYH